MKLFRTLLVVLTAGLLASQATARAGQTFVKVVQFASGVRESSAQIHQIVSDPDGTTWVAGVYQDRADFGGGIQLIGALAKTKYPFLAKQDANGGWIWAKTVSGGFALPNSPKTPASQSEGDLSVTAMFVGEDSIYIAGTQNRQEFGEKGTQPAENSFLMKVDKNGTVSWIRDFVRKTLLTSVVLGPDNHIYVGGNFGSDSAIYSGTVEISKGAKPNREAAVFKFDQNGNLLWRVYCGGAADSREIVAGLAADGVNIHVLMNVSGNSTARFGLYDFDDALLAGTTYTTQSGGVAPVVATLSTAGRWLGNTLNLLDAGTDFQGFSPAGLSALQADRLIGFSRVYGTDLQLIGGKIYASGSYHVSERAPGGSVPPSPQGSIKRGGFVVRLRADTHGPDGPVAYFRAPNDDHDTMPTRLRGLGGQVFAAGTMSTTLRVHTESSNVATPVGAIDAEATSVVRNRFLAKFDKDLNPVWLKTTTAANNIKAPSIFSADALGYDDTNQRLFWGGSFFCVGTEKLALGESPNVVQLTTALPDRENREWGWLTALGSDGEFLGQATLRVESTYSPIQVNGANVTVPAEFVFFRGTSTRIKAVGSEIGGTRKIVEGYSINNVPSAATGDDILLEVQDDTTVKFQWKTQHLLTIISDHGVSVLLSPLMSIGSPVPLQGKHWIDHDATVTPTIDGIVQLADAANLGTRYVLSAYSVQLTKTPLTGQPPPRVTLPSLTVTNPIEVGYFWKKQHSVTMNHTADSARELLLVRQMNRATGAEIAGTRVLVSGEHWFDAGAQIEVGAMNMNGNVALKGWRYGVPVATGYFPETSFSVTLDVSDDPSELDFRLDRRNLLVGNVSQQYWVLPVNTLTRAVNVLWDMGDTIYPFHVDVGAEVVITGTPALKAQKWSRANLIEGPAGGTGDNMLEWDEVAKKAYVTRPGIALFEWETTTGGKVVTQILAGFKGEPWQDNPAKFYSGENYYNHVANTPPVELDPSPTDGRFFKALLYATDDGSVNSSKFSAVRTGRSVLLFYKRTGGAAQGDKFKENVEVRVVDTKLWNDPSILATVTQAQPIGAKVSGGALDKALLGTGYVMHEVSNYNPEVHDRQGVRGPIIPVNRLNGGVTPTDKNLVVIWYETADGLLWPYKPVYYQNFAWTTINRIVIASRLGSEGFNSNNVPQTIFDPSKYSDVKIYNQPDRARAGFNPNEEHARIYPSLHQGLTGKNVPAAFALRNDLNVTAALIAARGGSLTAADYTSDPYVLVQYMDNTGSAPEAKMAVYAVNLEAADVNDPRVLELPGAVGANYTFNYKARAGEPITAPYPLNRAMGLQPCINTMPDLFTTSAKLPDGTYFEDGGPQRTWFVDHKNNAWVVSGGSWFTARFFYRLAEDFYYPFAQDASDAVTAAGDCLPLLPKLNLSAALANKDMSVFDVDFRTRSEPVAIKYQTVWPDNPPVLKVGETLTYAGGENKADNPDDPGLPGVTGFAAGEVVFDSKNPGMVSSLHASQFMARIIEPLKDRLVAIQTSELPANLNNPASPDVTVDGDTWYFNKLPPSLQKRIFFKPLAKLNRNANPGVLGLRGYLNDRTLGAGDLTAAPPPVYLLEPNVLTRQEVQVLKTDDNTQSSWNSKIDELFGLSRNPNAVPGTGWLVGLEQGKTLTGTTVTKPMIGLGPGLALVTNPDLLDPNDTLASGYVTIAENNHPSLGDAPVTLHVIKIDTAKRYRGSIKTVLPPNVFDEKISLRHSADFGGNVDNVAYDWWSHEEDGTVKAGDVPPGPNGNSPVWSLFPAPNGGLGQTQIELNGNPVLLLADNWFFTRYRHKNATTVAQWSAWAGGANSSIRDMDGDGKPDYRAQLATGWVKRVLDAINPYEARIREFGKNTSPTTGASLIQNLGAPFAGPVALNAAKDVVENLGLIELYETVLKRARDLSMDAAQPTVTSGINAAILLASTRLAEFYTLLGHEAWDDALDPTIGFGSGTVDAGNLNSSRFCFENQMSTLLDEELGLLRGVDESFGRPVYNRLFWNFTKAEGEVAYALNYAIKDINNDGFIDESDALKLYPMGHGDAWGHYLSAMRKRYDLLKSPIFNWEARSEYYNLLDVVLGVDFFDERNFARTAVARAKVGLEIVNLTFRSRYSEAPDARLSGYTDSNLDRAWGATEWARRAGQAALFDWISANAILAPAPLLSDGTEPKTGLQKLDRSAVPELSEIATQLAGLQGALDSANSGMNAIGLDPNVLPFDIDPTHIDVGSTAQIGRTAVQGLSHFEQIFERAYEALRNASVALDHANVQKARNRQVSQSAEQLRRQAVAQDLDYRNRLIEIFGTPYEGQIGAGKAYPAAYTGPDLNLFMYVDVNAVSPETVPASNSETYFDEYVSFHDLAADLPADFKDDIKEHFLDDISIEGNTAVELLGDDRIHLKLPATAQDYTFVAPESWGQRAAPGRLQTIVGEILQAQSDLTLAVGDYDYLIKQLRDRVALLQMRADISAENLAIKNEQYDTVVGLNAALAASKAAQVVLERLRVLQVNMFDGTEEFFPKVTGLAFDATSFARGSISTIAAVNNFVAGSLVDALTVADVALEGSKEIIALRDEIAIDKNEMSFELRGMLYDIEELLVNEGVHRVKLFSIREQVRGLLDQYRAILQRGIRLIEERRNVNAQLAVDTQENRYHDMLFRGARHESILRYRSLYDLAQRYCYMAAKAYDYETNFDPNDRASAQPLLADIVRARALGRLGDNFPIAGEGLAGLMARLFDNFRAVEGRLGFNNFQLDTTEFSIRKEKARVPDGDAAGWKAWLSAKKVDDLWQVSQFRRYCRPFAPRGSAQPGIVIELPTHIGAGMNFFQRPLGPGDSIYNPSIYATKIRAAGIRFEGYPIDQLTRTPYVYLIPAGLDYMTVPNSSSLATRSWNVVDQLIPVPHRTGSADLGRPDWIASLDVLGGHFGEIRKFSSFRAAVTVDDSALNVTRLVGRSVWNDKWLLIIPGQFMHILPDVGRDTFVDSVTDIKLTFETYGYSGN